MRLDLEKYKEYYRLKQVDTLNDELEKHVLSLNNLKNSPYLSLFHKKINHWSNQLNDISETLESMTQVQRQWMYLENIFMGSADIKKQLPSEASLFESVNNNWIEIMSKLAETCLATGVLESGLRTKLDRMNTTLEKINHSLDRYLETKRRRFPRFYFLSNDDLLEILGHATDPKFVQKHISKFFVGVKRLEVEERKNSPAEVIGFASSDGETCSMIPVSIENEVESWLGDVEKNIKTALAHQLIAVITEVQPPPNTPLAKTLQGSSISKDKKTHYCLD
jgi:dynein heavy chain